MRFEILQTLPSSIDWSEVCNNNYFATSETTSRSFQIKLNLKSIVTKTFNYMVWKLLIVIVVYFVKRNRRLSCTYFVIANLFKCCGVTCLTGFQKIFYNFNFENRYKLFGFEENNDIFQFIHALLLHARFFICRCKYSKCKHNMVQYFNLVYSIRQSEYFIAKSKHELHVHF